MYELTQIAHKEFYFKVPGAWKDKLSEWEILPQILASGFELENKVYVDLEEVESLPSELFSLLFDLAQEAGKQKAYLMYTCAREELEEKVSLLGTSAQ